MKRVNSTYQMDVKTGGMSRLAVLGKLQEVVHGEVSRAQLDWLKDTRTWGVEFGGEQGVKVVWVIVPAEHDHVETRDRLKEIVKSLETKETKDE